MYFNWSKMGIEIPTSKTTGKVKVRCPKCDRIRSDRRDKALSCDLDQGLFHCHYCGWSGSVVEYSEDEKQTWMERQPWYDRKPVRKQVKVYKKPKETGNPQLGERLIAYFKGRGISEQTLHDFRITEGLEWMPQKNKKVNTVQFNFYKNGVLLNTKYRTGDKCFKLVSGAELTLYNIDSILGAKQCIITEGEIDALSFHEAGFKAVVSVPNGASTNVSYLDDVLEKYFDDKETIFIASDTDTKGVILRDELVRRFGAERCRVLDYGEGCKDANEHLVKYGKASLLECLNNAPEYRMDGVFQVSDFEQSLDALFEYGMQKGVTTGHENFDNLISFETKRLCIVTGIPGSGKSEFIDEMAERLNMRYAWKWAYFSPENAPLAYHASKLIEKFTGKKFSQSTLPLPEYRQVKAHLEENFFFIAPESDYKLDTILDRAKFLVRRKGIKALVIDPYNRLESERDGGTSETLYISQMLDKLTNFAQLNDVLVVLMAHPTKQQKGKNGVVEAPTLYDISGSANFFNKADFGIVVHRNMREGYVEIHVQKVKFRHLGQVGTCFMKYNVRNGRYSPYDRELGIEPLWDNSNHLVAQQNEEQQSREEGNRLDFGRGAESADSGEAAIGDAASDGMPFPSGLPF